ncbi:hypothetical protein CYLTODRAFT_492581 [Cylindrobasidium torrendii FP15055 ss-10]|uniref:Uncharacterized protein n=1 Tax=Cylindrobasidium torrendii FP15055 ss-10 TaxID=1314674 RepID=A0A0D7B4G6_9AGAR|nr:hypothetical protein CYLTODRAFT_492581 [Cylindrobasidium torrendii FP15055 ss-10]
MFQLYPSKVLARIAYWVATDHTGGSDIAASLHYSLCCSQTRDATRTLYLARMTFDEGNKHLIRQLYELTVKDPAIYAHLKSITINYQMSFDEWVLFAYMAQFFRSTVSVTLAGVHHVGSTPPGFQKICDNCKDMLFEDSTIDTKILDMVFRAHLDRVGLTRTEILAHPNHTTVCPPLAYTVSIWPGMSGEQGIHPLIVFPTDGNGYPTRIRKAFITVNHLGYPNWLKISRHTLKKIYIIFRDPSSTQYNFFNSFDALSAVHVSIQQRHIRSMQADFIAGIPVVSRVEFTINGNVPTPTDWQHLDGLLQRSPLIERVVYRFFVSTAQQITMSTAARVCSQAVNYTSGRYNVVAVVETSTHSIIRQSQYRL